MTSGPIGLLGGLIKKPDVLFWHFFSVAFLSLWLVITEPPKVTEAATLESTHILV
jgi:squalene monooxygenase